MRRTLIATHGEFAGGLKQTMDFVLRENKKVGVLSVYTTPDSDMDREVVAMVDELGDGDEPIVMTDVLDGSAANAFPEHISHPGAYVLAGVSMPMLLAMVPILESTMDTQELITQGIQAVREGCMFINGLTKQAFEGSEEDFVWLRLQKWIRDWYMNG